MGEIEIYTETLRKHYDPTHTTSLRNAFSKNMKKRFLELMVVIKKAVVDQDCFGLEKGVIQAFQLIPPGTGAFSFRRSSAKVEEFMKWLESQVEKGLLTVGRYQQIGSAVEAAWTNMYILDSYKRGVIRAREEMQKAGYKVPSIEMSGGIEMIIAQIIHMDRLGLLYTRTFSDLKGITAAMDMQISRVLAQGIADGDGMRLIARKILSTISGTDAQKLGITDTLGRFIPAARRAEMLARTEIIRAFHQATIQEYRNWGVEGVNVQAEWKTAGDSRVCPKCMGMEGKIFTLDEIEPLIPLHPMCFIDFQIPIYTSEGWKPIGKVKIGDLVLTHKRRFRKVYALPRSISENAEIITFRFEGTRMWLSITSNHPVLLTTKSRNISRTRWVEAGKVKEGEYLNLLGNNCKRCRKSIPYFRQYCSHSCLSKDVTDRQWSNPKHRKNMSKKATEQLNREYLLGIRNGEKITKKAHEKMKELGQMGLHPFQNKEVRKKINEGTHTSELNKMHSERMKKNNPMNDPIIVEKAKDSLARYYFQNPERRINARMAKYRKSGLKTWIEERMALLLDKLGVEYVFQYPILRYNVDFAIPELKIVIECDGEQWHQDKEKEEIRQERIENQGWIVLRYTGEKINQCLPEIEKELTRVLCNHLGEFELCDWSVQNIKKWTLRKARLLYNLSVEEDESYIAKGIVVHNCRCIALPVIVN